MFKQGRYQDAINEYTKAIKIDPKNAAYYNNRATALIKLGRYQEAKNDAQKSVQIDPNYEKGAQKLVEASLKCGELQQSQQIAEKLYNMNMSTKNRELLNDAQRAIRIQSSFDKQLDDTFKNLVQVICESVNQITQQKYPLFSTQQRQESIKNHDDFELGVCKIVEPLRQQRDKLVELGMKTTREDFEFWTRTLPNIPLPYDTIAKYYLVMSMFVLIANRFTKFQLLGYQDDENTNNDQDYYQKMLQASISRCSTSMKNLIQCCIYLEQEQYNNAIPLLQKLVQQYPDIAKIAQAYNTYNQLKATGTQQYKSRDHQSAYNTFMQATQTILPYQQLNQPQEMTAGFAIILLSILSLPATTLSNASMAIQATNPGSSICLLLASTFLNTQYAKAHLRLAKFFESKQMWGEAEQHYGFASQIDKNDTQSQQAAQACQKQKNAYLRMNYYELLGITDHSINTDSQEYQKIYKRMAAKWHPDRYSRDPVMKHFAEKKFREIQEANEVLTDKQKRMIYDQGGDPVHMGQAGMSSMNGAPFDMSSMFQGGQGFTDMSDLFQSMFGGMGGGNVHFSVNGQDIPMQQFSNAKRGGKQPQGFSSMGGIPFDLFRQFGF